MGLASTKYKELKENDIWEASSLEEEKLIALEAKPTNPKENPIKRKTGKGHLKDENEGPAKKKDNFTQKKSKPIWITQ